MHTRWLKLLEAHYQQQGRRTYILTRTAATTFDGHITLLEPISLTLRGRTCICMLVGISYSPCAPMVAYNLVAHARSTFRVDKWT